MKKLNNEINLSAIDAFILSKEIAKNLHEVIKRDKTIQLVNNGKKRYYYHNKAANTLNACTKISKPLKSN